MLELELLLFTLINDQVETFSSSQQRPLLVTHFCAEGEPLSIALEKFSFYSIILEIDGNRVISNRRVTFGGATNILSGPRVLSTAVATMPPCIDP
jgi:hypothetical protein